MPELVGFVPPHNLEAEQSSLGSMMLERVALMAGVESLRADDFYRPCHQEVFAALAALAEGNEPVDLITLQEELRSRGKLEDCGGTEYLMALVDSIPTAANIDHYAAIVSRKSLLRRMIAAGREISGLGFEEESDVDELVTKARTLVLGLERKQSGEWHGIAEGVDKAWEKMMLEYEGDSRPGIPYGVPDLSRLTYGVEMSDCEFTLIAGRPSAGKTVLLNDIAVNAALAGYHVLYFSQETSFEKLSRNMIFARAKVNSFKYRYKNWESDDEEAAAFARLAEASGELHNLEPLIMMSDISRKAPDIVAATHRAVLSNKADIVLVDYLQIVGQSGKSVNRNEAVGEITRTLRSIPRDLKIPFVAASQLSRPPKEVKRAYKPTMADLREGGSQEAEADKIIIVDNSNEQDNIQPNGLRRATFIVGKAKGGPTGDVPAWFDAGWFIPNESHYAEEVDRENYANPFGNGATRAWGQS